jgi:hypothetical protein
MPRVNNLTGQHNKDDLKSPASRKFLFEVDTDVLFASKSETRIEAMCSRAAETARARRLQRDASSHYSPPFDFSDELAANPAPSRFRGDNNGGKPASQRCVFEKVDELIRRKPDDYRRMDRDDDATAFGRSLGKAPHDLVDTHRITKLIQ